MPRRRGRLLGLLLLGGCSWWRQAEASCNAWGWFDTYGGERCFNDGNTMMIQCQDKYRGASCGARLMHTDRFGVGDMAMRIRAAPGAGVVTSLYVSNNGGLRPAGGSWSEVAFEVMGNQAKEGSSRIWTNYFTGQGLEHHGMASVPFDAAAADHSYTIRINSTHIQWLVDDHPIRTDDFTSYPDMVAAVKAKTFQGFAGMWGRAEVDPPGPLGSQEFTEGMGMLNQNTDLFPVHASFKPEEGMPPGTISNLTSWFETQDISFLSREQKPDWPTTVEIWFQGSAAVICIFLIMFVVVCSMPATI